MFKHLRTRTQLAAGFTLALVAMAAIAAVAALGLSRLNGTVETLARQHVVAFQALARIDAGHLAVARSLNALSLRRASDPELRRKLYGALDEAFAGVQAGVEAWESHPHVAASAELWSVFRPQLDAWLASTRAVRARLEQRDLLRKGPGDPAWDEADEAVWRGWLDMREKVAPVDATLARLVERGQANVGEAEARAGATYRGVTAQVWIAVLLAAASLIAIGVVIARRVDGTIRGLTAEAGRLTAAVHDGRFDVRGEEGRLAPEFRPIVHGMNEVMDAFVAPVEQSIRIAERLAEGEAPPRIEEAYRGRFEDVKRAWNALGDGMRRRAADLDRLLASARSGDLGARADAAAYSGANRKMIEDLNGLVDAVAVPIREAVRVMERLADRDLTARMEGRFAGEFEQARVAVDATAAALESALSQVRSAAEGVSAAAGQISSGAQALASGASEQASSLEETGASLESMTGMVRASADHAAQASALARSATTSCAEGSEAMRAMGDAMSRIRASAEGTAEIIKEVNEIAFQTNLLALNAAVEAARAGDAGRGFAVVAEEVRSLALRSKGAAQRTEALIQESVRETAAGETTAHSVRAKLEAIEGGVGKVASLVDEMAASSREQASGIDGINRAVAQMNTVTQQNAASSEESSSAAVELTSQAEELARMVQSFRLGDAEARGDGAVTDARERSLRRPQPARALPARRAEAA